jgi:hypothetical protein
MPRFYPASQVVDVAEAARGEAFGHAMGEDAALADECKSGVLGRDRRHGLPDSDDFRTGAQSCMFFTVKNGRIASEAPLHGSAMAPRSHKKGYCADFLCPAVLRPDELVAIKT